VIFADTPSSHQSLFVSSTEASAFAISATTGLIVPSTYQPMRMLQIHSQASQTGVRFDSPNRRAEYQRLMKVGDVRGKALLIEKIGDLGARQYAQSMKFIPLYQGMPGQGKGFDQVYRFGQQIVVVEAKGGGSPLKVYHGYKQGTPDYVIEVAKRTLQSRSTTPAAKQAAYEVIKAHRENRLTIKAIRTQHVLGKPNKTTVETTHRQLSVPSTLKIAHQAGLVGGVAGAGIGGAFELFRQLSSNQAVNWEQLGGMTLLGGSSHYYGTLSGAIMQNALMNNESRLLSQLIPTTKVSPAFVGGLSGGLVATAIFSYSAYFLGYADLKTANRSMIAGTIGAGTLALGSALVTPTVLTGLATSVLGAVGATASTGTAIASLSGAAATNATLAVLGGGTVAAGGGGVAGGTAVIGTLSATGVGLVAVAAIGIGAGAMYLFQISDENTERLRVSHLLTSLENDLNKPL